MAIRFIGAGIGTGAQDHRTEFGPDALKQSQIVSKLKTNDRFDEISWDTTLYPRFNPMNKKHPVVLEFTNRLQKVVAKVLTENDFPIVIGGDHSCAIGTWSGISRVIHEYGQGDLGLIWIDAHLDSHTFETTPSNAIHGMPLAILMGYGKPDMVNLCNFKPKIKPENVKIIGARSYEPDERKLLDNIGVEVYYIEDVQNRSFEDVLAEAIKNVKANTTYYGISLDLDALDPSVIKGVGSPEPNGLVLHDVVEAFKNLKVGQDPRLIGFELAEFNPHLDDGETLRAIEQILPALIGS